MATIELTAKTLADAKATAATKLGVSAEHLTVTVLEETKGLFGRSQVRIRAEANAAAESTAKAPEAPKKESKPASKTAKKAEPKAEAEPKPEPESESAAPVAAPAPKRKGKEKAPEAAPAAATEAGTADARPEVIATQEDAEMMLNLVSTLIEKAGIEVQVAIRDVTGKYVTISFDGNDAAYLVGKQGEVLNAMQSLVNIIAGRKYESGVRVVLDGNDFRTKREAKLQAMAVRLAEEVKKRGEEAVLDALPAFERRVVHKALSEIDGVSTYSEGEEPNRRLVIAPAD